MALESPPFSWITQAFVPKGSISSASYTGGYSRKIKQENSDLFVLHTSELTIPTSVQGFVTLFLLSVPLSLSDSSTSEGNEVLDLLAHLGF